jgi:NADH-quinone oxidoreductase subunit L
MMIGLGVGGVAVGMFHLITHAFFKALLFLGSGSVIHGCHEEQDVRKMGGLRKYMPVTFAVYAVGMLALSGFPLLSGFWSKDEILHQAHGWPVSQIPFYLGCCGALFTAFYMTRQVALVFFGQYRGDARESTADAHAHGHDQPSGHGQPSSHEDGHGTPHESPAVMTVPLIILAVFAILLGVIGTPAWPWFEGYMNGEAKAFDLGRFGDTWILMAVSSLIVFTGLGFGWLLYGARQRKTAEEKDVLEAALPPVFKVLQNKYYIDEFYELTVIRLNAMAASFCDFLDDWVFGGLVQLVSYVALGFAKLYRLMDDYLVNFGFDSGCSTLRGLGGVSSWANSGRVQTYLRVIGVALVVLIIILAWGLKA